MAKTVEKVEQPEVKDKGAREARWEKFLESYKLQNPVRYARLEASGELKNIPDTFN